MREMMGYFDKSELRQEAFVMFFSRGPESISVSEEHFPDSHSHARVATIRTAWSVGVRLE